MELSNQSLKQVGMSLRAECMWYLLYFIVALISAFFYHPLAYVNYVFLVFIVINMWKMGHGLGYRTAVTVFLCVLMIIPITSLITLIVMTNIACHKLKKAGLHVGLLGVSKKDLENLN